MTRLADLDTMLLSTASQRDGNSLLPAPQSARATGARLQKAIARLLDSGLAEERGTSDAAAMYRSDGDQSYGAFITCAGLAAIGVRDAPADDPVLPAAEPASPAPTKASQVLALLRRAEGATLAELVAATGWLPHTTRAALTGLRKKGHVLAKSKRGEATCYRIEVAA